MFISLVYYARKRLTCPFDPRRGFRCTLWTVWVPSSIRRTTRELALRVLRIRHQPYLGFGRVQDVLSLMCVRVRLVSRVHSMADSFTITSASTWVMRWVLHAAKGARFLDACRARHVCICIECCENMSKFCTRWKHPETRMAVTLGPQTVCTCTSFRMTISIV